MTALHRAGLRLAAFSSELHAQTAALALRHGLTYYDASFAALAVRDGCDLMTADRKAFGSLDCCPVRFL